MINQPEASLAEHDILLPETRALRDQRVAYLEAELALYRARSENFFDVRPNGARAKAATGLEKAYGELQVAVLVQERALPGMKRSPQQHTPLLGEPIPNTSGREDIRQAEVGASKERQRVLALLGPHREQKAWFAACGTVGVNPLLP